MATSTSKGQKKIQSNDGQINIGITKRKVQITADGTPALNANLFDFLLNDNTDTLFRIIGEGVATIPSGSVPSNNSVEFAAPLIPYSNFPSVPIVEAWVASGDGLSPFGGVFPTNPVDTGTSFEFKQIYSQNVGVIPSSSSSGNIKIYTSVSNADSISFTYIGDEVKYYILAKSANI